MTQPLVLPPLGDLQWSLNDTVVMGPGTEYNVQTFTVGTASTRTQDAERDDGDGEDFGVDTRGGRLITLAVNTDLYTEAEGLDALDRFEAAWDDEETRAVPGAVSILRWRRGTRVRRAYGRARDCLPDHGRDWTGNIPITATFKTADGRFYDDTENVEWVDLSPDESEGLIGDLIGDLVSSGDGSGSRGFRLGGSRPAWIPIVIHGPIINPSVEIVGQWTVRLTSTLGEGEYVLIDPTPWSRDVRTASGANAAGDLTADSPLLSQMKLRPGLHSAVLRGNDPTGTARAAIYLRNCHASH